MVTIQNSPKARTGSRPVRVSARNNKKAEGESSQGVVGPSVGGTENIKLIGATLNTKVREMLGQECGPVDTPQSYIDHSTLTNTPTYGTVNIFMVGSVGDLFLANVTIS